MTCNANSLLPYIRPAAAKLLISIAASAALVLPPLSSAQAVSGAVKQACKSDYFAYCSSHAVGSQSLRACMRRAGPKLSKRCVRALVAAGEVSKSDSARYARRSR